MSPAKTTAKTTARPAKPTKKVAKKAVKAPAKANGHAKPTRKGKAAPDVALADPSLFDPLTPGEVADALRTLTEDRRMLGIAKVGRYRVICVEPLVVKPPNWMAGHRLARVVVFDYANDRSVDATVDLDAGVVAHLEFGKGQPMLSREEEAIATSIAMVDPRVRERLGIGDEPISVLHYWGRTRGDLAFARRSAAVLFGREGGHISLVAVVDLLDQTVTAVVPAEQW
jgi:hypothetical protein